MGRITLRRAGTDRPVRWACRMQRLTDRAREMHLVAARTGPARRGGRHGHRNVARPDDATQHPGAVVAEGSSSVRLRPEHRPAGATKSAPAPNGTPVGTLNARHPSMDDGA